MVGKILDQTVIRRVVKGNVGVILCQPEVNLIRMPYALPSLIGRTPDRSVIHCKGQMSHRGHSG